MLIPAQDTATLQYVLPPVSSGVLMLDQKMSAEDLISQIYQVVGLHTNTQTHVSGTTAVTMMSTGVLESVKSGTDARRTGESIVPDIGTGRPARNPMTPLCVRRVQNK